MTCTAARKWASWATNSTATPNRVATRQRAECTGLRRQDHAERARQHDDGADREDGGLHQWPPLAVDVSVGVGSSAPACIARVWPARALTPKPSSPDQADPALVVGVADGAVARIQADVCGATVVAVGPVLPRQLLRQAVVVDQQLVLGVDGVGPVGEGELEQLRLGDRLGRAGLDAQVAVDAAQVVDLVDEAVALAGADRVVGRVVGAADVDAAGRAHAGAQLAADALLHAVLVAVEDVTAVEAVRLVPLAALVLGVLAGDAAASCPSGGT